MKIKIHFARRSKITRRELTKQRAYRSDCGRFEIIEVRWLIDSGYGHYWLAVGRAEPFLFLSRHRTRKAAERRCREAIEAEVPVEQWEKP